MAKRKPKSLVKTIKKVARENRLAREKVVGKPRAKTFGGKPNPRKVRREQKNELRRIDKEAGL